MLVGLGFAVWLYTVDFRGLNGMMVVKKITVNRDHPAVRAISSDISMKGVIDNHAATNQANVLPTY